MKLGENKIEILKGLKSLGGVFEKPRGGWWKFFEQFGHYSTYAANFYQHLTDLINSECINDEEKELILTKKGEKILSMHKNRECTTYKAFGWYRVFIIS